MQEYNLRGIHLFFALSLMLNLALAIAVGTKIFVGPNLQELAYLDCVKSGVRPWNCYAVLRNNIILNEHEMRKK